MTQLAMPSAPTTTTTAMSVVVFRVAGQRFALPLGAVEFVAPMVEITPLPDAPECAAGVINVHGSLMPVIDCRRYFGLPVRGIDPNDHLVIARQGTRELALWVDEVEGVQPLPEDGIVPADAILPCTQTQGLMKLPDGEIVLLPGLDRCLSPEDENQLMLALESA